MTERNVEEIAALAASVGEHGLGGINPDAAQLEALIAANRGGPLQFVNLLSYRALAEYPDGHELAAAHLSGAQAYDRYGAVALGHVVRRGGRLTCYNAVEQVLIGTGARWDQVAIMEYPDTEAFLDMISDPDYVAALVHRDAGLADTVLLVTRPLLG